MLRFFIIFIFPIVTAYSQSYSVRPDTLIEAFMNHGDVPGLFVAVVKGDCVLYSKSFGYRNLENRIEMTSKTCMELGSLTKLFAGEIIKHLHKGGKINLQDPITKYFRDAPRSWKTITIHHLLTHTSGIQNYLLDPRFKAAELFGGTEDNSVLDFFNHVPADSMVKLFYSLPLEFEPGASWSYSNTGYYLLGKIAEKASGHNFFEMLENQIALPLRMATLKPNELAQKEGCLANGYYENNGKLRSSSVLTSNYAFSAGALATTGEDMVKVLKAINNGHLVTDSLEKNSRFAHFNEKMPFNYQAGSFYTTFHGMNVLFHNGGTPGFSSSWFTIPEKKLSIIVLVNRQDYPAIDQFAWDLISIFDTSLKYPSERLKNNEVTRYSTVLTNIIRSIEVGSKDFEGVTDPLKIFLKSENGSGLWKWYFVRGFPKDLYCVDRENTGNSKLFRFRLPYSDKVEYRLTIRVNSENQVAEMRWW